MYVFGELCTKKNLATLPPTLEGSVLGEKQFAEKM
jgi:hypothetical protein